MDPRHLATFEAVATARSFSRAAEALGYAQSSVTAHVQALERELDTRLFDRLGRRVVPTPAGVTLLAYATKLRLLTEEARQAVTQESEPTGRLAIGVTESLCTYRLPAVLAAFRERHPRVEVAFHAGACATLRRRLQAGELDLAFLLEPPVPAPALTLEPLRTEPIALVGRPGDVVTGLEDVTTHTLLVPEAGGSYREALEGLLAAAGVRPQARLEFASLEAIKQCARAGMGLALLPEMAVAQEVAAGQLEVVLPLALDPPVQMVMAWHRGKWITSAMRAFMAIARERRAT